MVGTVKFEARIHELVADHPDLAAIVEPLLIGRGSCASNSGCFTANCLRSCATMRSAAG